MVKIRTENFELATVSAGDPDSEVVLIACAGLPETKDYPHIQTLLGHIAGRGFYAVGFDAPGIGESYGAYFTTNYVQATLELAGRVGYGRQVVLAGHSLGGRVATVAAARNPALVQGLVSIMSANEFVREANRPERIDEWKNDGVKAFPVDPRYHPGGPTEITLPYIFSKDAQRYKATDGIAGLLMPKLFIAGSKDEVVPLEIVQGVFDAAPEPKELVQVDAEHHYRLSPEAMDVVNSYVSGFIARHFITPPTPTNQKSLD